MNKGVLCAAALVSGLLFCCPEVEASDYLWPKAGFQEWEYQIECEPAKHLPRYFLPEEDEDLVMRIGVLEGGETDPEAIAHVIQVVMNRFESDAFPNTISGVLYQEKQFTSVKRLHKANVTDAAKEALEAVERGDYADNEALYFESLEGKVWSNVHEYQFSYGGHDFYK